MSVTEYFH